MQQKHYKKKVTDNTLEGARNAAEVAKNAAAKVKEILKELPDATREAAKAVMIKTQTAAKNLEKAISNVPGPDEEAVALPKQKKQTRKPAEAEAPSPHTPPSANTHPSENTLNTVIPAPAANNAHLPANAYVPPAPANAPGNGSAANQPAKNKTALEKYEETVKPIINLVALIFAVAVIAYLYYNKHTAKLLSGNDNSNQLGK